MVCLKFQVEWLDDFDSFTMTVTSQSIPDIVHHTCSMVGQITDILSRQAINLHPLPASLAAAENESPAT